jgi:putative aldouronate transport system substrate-binding protein
MKRNRAVMAAVLAAAMLASAGCARKEAGGTETGEARQISLDKGPSWSQDKTPYTLKWFVAYDWYGKTFNPALNWGDKKILDSTGTALEITAGNTEKLNLLISTGDLPDMVTFDIIAAQRTLLEDGGVLLDLEELAAKYAPDLNVPQSQKDWYRAKDGKWYAIASFYYGPERTSPEFGGYYVTHNLNYARKDILDQIGISIEDLQTKEGFLNALREVKRRKMQYNGKEILPYIGGWPDGLAAQFGADLEDPAGNLLNIRRQNEYLEALLYMNTLFNEGLITDEQYTMNTQQRDQKVANGEVFAASGWVTVENPRKALYSLDPGAQFLYAGVIRGGAGGRQPILEGVSCGGWTGTMITKNCKNPAKAIQFLSYMTSEEAALDAYYGTGVYDVINGKAARKPAAVKEFADNYQAAFSKYMYDISFFMDWTIIEKYSPEPGQDALYYERDHYKQEHDRSITLYDNKAFTLVMPDDGTDLSVTKVRVDDYWNQQEPKMIMAKSGAECERIYREALAQADALGMKELDDYQNSRFKENKKKLGVLRIWPR